MQAVRGVGLVGRQARGRAAGCATRRSRRRSSGWGRLGGDVDEVGEPPVVLGVGLVALGDGGQACPRRGRAGVRSPRVRGLRAAAGRWRPRWRRSSSMLWRVRASIRAVAAAAGSCSEAVAAIRSTATLRSAMSLRELPTTATLSGLIAAGSLSRTSLQRPVGVRGDQDPLALREQVGEQCGGGVGLAGAGRPWTTVWARRVDRGEDLAAAGSLTGSGKKISSSIVDRRRRGSVSCVGLGLLVGVDERQQPGGDVLGLGELRHDRVEDLHEPLLRPLAQDQRGGVRRGRRCGVPGGTVSSSWYSPSASRVWTRRRARAPTSSRCRGCRSNAWRLVFTSLMCLGLRIRPGSSMSSSTVSGSSPGSRVTVRRPVSSSKWMSAGQVSMCRRTAGCPRVPGEAPDAEDELELLGVGAGLDVGGEERAVQLADGPVCPLGLGPGRPLGDPAFVLDLHLGVVLETYPALGAF